MGWRMAALAFTLAAAGAAGAAAASPADTLPTPRLPRLTPVVPGSRPGPALDPLAPLGPPPAVLAPLPDITDAPPGDEAAPPVPDPTLAPGAVPAGAPGAVPAGEAAEPEPGGPVPSVPRPTVKPAPSGAPAAVPSIVTAPPPRPAEKPALPAAAESARSPSVPPPSRTGPHPVWALTDVYVRAEPRYGARIVDGVRPGDRLTALPGEAPDGWTRVARGEAPIGYVASAYIDDEPPGQRRSVPPAPEGGEEEGCFLPPGFEAPSRPRLPKGSVARAVVASNVRATPDCGARVLDVLEAGEAVTIQGAAGGWSRVARDGRFIGYVSTVLLRPAARR